MKIVPTYTWSLTYNFHWDVHNVTTMYRGNHRWVDTWITLWTFHNSERCRVMWTANTITSDQMISVIDNLVSIKFPRNSVIDTNCYKLNRQCKILWSWKLDNFYKWISDNVGNHCRKLIKIKYINDIIIMELSYMHCWLKTPSS